MKLVARESEQLAFLAALARSHCALVARGRLDGALLIKAAPSRRGHFKGATPARPGSLGLKNQLPATTTNTKASVGRASSRRAQLIGVALS